MTIIHFQEKKLDIQFFKKYIDSNQSMIPEDFVRLKPLIISIRFWNIENKKLLICFAFLNN